MSLAFATRFANAAWQYRQTAQLDHVTSRRVGRRVSSEIILNIMKMSDLHKRYPLVAMVGAFVIVSACMAIVTGSDLASQVMGTSLAAIASLVVLYVLVPTAVDRFPYKGASSFVGEGETDVLRLACSVVLAGAAGGICILAFCLVGATVDAAGDSSAVGGELVSAGEYFARAVLVLLLCMVTGLSEEGLFRGVVVSCAYWHAKKTVGDGENNPAVMAAALSALLFGLVHVLGSDVSTLASAATASPAAADVSALAASSAATTSATASALATSAAPAALVGVSESDAVLTMVVLVAQGIFKMTQAALFGFCMAALFMRTGTIWLAVATHAAFDMLYLGPQLVLTGAVPSTYLTGNPADLAVVVLTVVLLLRPCAKSLGWLQDGVVTYSSFHE